MLLNLIIDAIFFGFIKIPLSDRVLLKVTNRFHQTLNRKAGPYFSKEYNRFPNKNDSANLQIQVRKSNYLSYRY